MTTAAAALRSLILLAAVLLIAATLSSATPVTRPSPRAPARALSATTEGFADQLEAIKNFALKKLKETIGFVGSNDIVAFLWKCITFISKLIWYIVSDPHARADTAINWIVDSMLNPFKTLTDGMNSFMRLFRYIHKIRKQTQAGLGSQNLVYQCFKSMHPACVAKASNSIDSILIYNFYCAYLFFEKCQLHYWFTKGEWKVPDINGDICHLHPEGGKCPDQPPPPGHL